MLHKQCDTQGVFMLKIFFLNHGNLKIRGFERMRKYKTNAVNTPIILLFSVFKSRFYFWLTQSNAFDSSNLLFNVS
jgi:hypothetical protein